MRILLTRANAVHEKATTVTSKRPEMSNGNLRSMERHRSGDRCVYGSSITAE